ncbi:hypothetical protein C9374_010404 [Naegleria lovaniensis]|uniref:VWFA domain-containing protein n=1 Tax=Naegleria lovaniensis TaxID=51637 RepID=A0AA88KJE4_NAELO|nr:uncharacterized protein C9374_010404 [Naegleria lovaniensis]KAG2374827.1 hypothetical protein C9374_010404 [Naegleria lovaniensis]
MNVNNIFLQFANRWGLVPVGSLVPLLKACKVRYHLEEKVMAMIVDEQNSGFFDRPTFDSLLEKITQHNSVQQNIWGKSPRYIDLCFLLDITKSMDKWLLESIQVITSIIDEVSKVNRNVSIRYGFVGYRDLDCTERFVVEPFTFDKTDIVHQLKQVQCFGGGDYPEDVDGGLEQVLKNMEWASFTRVLIHIADAPGHGAHHHNFAEKDDWYYYQHDPSGTEQLVKELVHKKIDYYFFEIHSCTQKMVRTFQQWMYEANPIENQYKYGLSVEPITSDMESLAFLRKVSNIVVDTVRLSETRKSSHENSTVIPNNFVQKPPNTNNTQVVLHHPQCTPSKELVQQFIDSLGVLEQVSINVKSKVTFLTFQSTAVSSYFVNQVKKQKECRTKPTYQELFSCWPFDIASEQGNDRTEHILLQATILNLTQLISFSTYEISKKN